MIKILAPAGSFEGCSAAFEAGAQGVYLGVKNWSRGAPGNALADAEIARCIGLARSGNKVVHVALNTIPAHQDTGWLVEKCLYYTSLGAGGLILNDFGLMARVLSMNRDAPVYASVGCGIANEAEAGFYSELGVAGVVLPPGVPPGEVKRIKERYALMVEIFCEALLEPFVFGKCWLGSYCSVRRKKSGGKELFFGSAKRGVCSKSCKAGWEIARGKEVVGQRYRFSFEPCSLWESLRAYQAAGTDLIKIQGRELAPEAVVEIVKKYQYALREDRDQHGADDPGFQFR